MQRAGYSPLQCKKRITAREPAAGGAQNAHQPAGGLRLSPRPEAAGEWYSQYQQQKGGEGRATP